MKRKMFKDKVMAELMAIELDYERAKKLGVRAIRILESIIELGDEPLATRAVYLAAHIGGRRGESIVKKAAKHPLDSVRIAVAGSLHLLPESEALDMFSFLIGDIRDDVAFSAVRSVGRIDGSRMPQLLASIMTNHRAEYIRYEAKRIFYSKSIM